MMVSLRRGLLGSGQVETTLKETADLRVPGNSSP